ncbi:28S ribosomal protein S31, mitochondrial isoform X2 [Hemicordylus capensis]|uniref:28S ribosomal protein S31, mitochondrial isoform X2 n=1 Tax=Hemicordylus capensis TaxID=884348 RepID=UPI002303B7FB|nr:28S ribosomal protein S31, mitochondrial isoform X2 [Hemicordylus capensis]
MWWRSLLVPGTFRGSLRLHVPGRGVVSQDSKTHKCLGTSSVFCTKKDEPVPPVNSDTKTSDTKASQNQEKMQVTSKKNLLSIISEMKVEISSKKKFQKLKAQKIKDQARDLPEKIESASSMFQQATEDKAKSKTLNPELVEAASAVASSLPLDRKRTVSELLQLLKKHKEVTDARKNGEIPDISNIVANMKIGRKPPARDALRPSNQIQFDDDGQGYIFERSVPRGFAGTKGRGLFSGKRLNIFTHPSATEDTLETVTAPTLWDLELAKEIAAVSQKVPRNGFEEMIQWTKEGKLWEFPINNEAGLEDDAEFYEHIFLDKYITDFPKEGPIRHFMELITCGLSKNPYLSVKEKVEHIEWFRDYFKEKEELLKEIEAHEKEILVEREKLSK